MFSSYTDEDKVLAAVREQAEGLVLVLFECGSVVASVLARGLVLYELVVRGLVAEQPQAPLEKYNFFGRIFVTVSCWDIEHDSIYVQFTQRVTSHCILSVYEIAYFIAYNDRK